MSTIMSDINKTASGEISTNAMSNLVVTRNGRFSSHGIETLVERFMTSGCSETRDRIYGLLGLAQDVESISTSEKRVDPVQSYIHQVDFGEPYLPKPELGSGLIKVDYERSFYDIWGDVIKLIFFRSNLHGAGNVRIPGQGDNSLQESSFISSKKRLTLIRTASMVQAALDQKVQQDVLEMFLINVKLRAWH
jgi:hypothetical protein